MDRYDQWPLMDCAPAQRERGCNEGRARAVQVVVLYARVGSQGRVGDR